MLRHVRCSPSGTKLKINSFGDQPPHQPFGVLEIMLAPPRGTVGESLRQLQTHIRLQLQPHRPPVLGSRFHDRFFHPLLPQPESIIGASRSAWLQIAAAPASHSGVLGIDHYHHQHFLVYVNSRYLVGHASSRRGSGRTRAKRRYDTVTCYHPSRRAGGAHTDWFKTHVPDQTRTRPHFIQSARRPLPSHARSDRTRLL